MLCLSFSKRANRRSSGFTLIELLIVLVVLASLAALVVPMLGWARKQSEFATAASGAAEAFNNLELYRAATGRYPDRFDSLLTNQGQLYTTTSDGRNVWQGPIRLDQVAEVAPGTGAGTLSMGIITYYLANDGSLTSFVNHNPAARSTFSGPNTSTEGSQVFTVNGTITPAVMDPGPDGILGNEDDVVATPAVLQNVAVVRRTATPFGPPGRTNVGTLARIIRAAYPDQVDPNTPTIPAGHALIAVGIGGRNSAVGSTMSSIPQAAGVEAGNYGRYIAFFDVEAGPTGRGRVNLKLVTDPSFTTIGQNIDRYKGAGPVQ
jgi:prepilin-type N-terminal cleavage/methylation domain-containing protein